MRLSDGLTDLVASLTFGDLAANSDLLNQLLNVFDQSCWSKTLLVNTYLWKTAMVIETVWRELS
jgi:hypothetical protein